MLRTPPLAAWCSPCAVFTMFRKYPEPKVVVTVLAIVWYVLDIVLKTVQLLRQSTRVKSLPGRPGGAEFFRDLDVNLSIASGYGKGCRYCI